MSRPALGLGIALLAVLGAWSSFSALAPSATAHALLVGSRPASGASLRHSPSRLLLIFTEAPDPELSAVQVLDAAGRIVGGVSNARPLPGRPAALQVSLSRPLADGVYTVVWRTVSSVDGHVAQSSFPFGVGVVAAGRSSPAGAVAGVSTALEAYQAAGRWLLYWGLALFVGAAAISWLVLGGRTPDHGRLLIAAAWLLAVAGVAVMIAAERSIVGVPLGSLLGTSVGGVFLAQGVAVLACGVAAGAFVARPGRWTIAVVGLVAAGALLVHVRGGHAGGASPFRTLDLADQWVHATAAGVWIGGLVWLLLGLRRRERADQARLARRFSAVAAVALGIVLATGVARAVPEVGTPGDLLRTSFGAALLAKIVLVFVLVSLGAANRYRVMPALNGGEEAARKFRWVSRGEIVVAAGVFGATAVLTGLAPSAFTAAAGKAAASQRVVVSAGDYASSVAVRLTVSPGNVGRNVFVARVDRYGTSEPAPARSVELAFSLPAHPGLGSSLVLRRTAGGSWTGAGLQLSIVGDWRVEAVIAEPANAVVVPLTIRVGSP